jgi:YfiH family protein
VDLIAPDWPAPPWVRAYSTTRSGGVSDGPYASLNLGDHVGDLPARVAHNRALLRSHLGLTGEPLWLQQVHGTHVACAEPLPAATAPVARALEADGARASTPGVVCVVMTADCLPLLMCDTQGTRIAAVHAGWRGLAAGVVERAVAALQCLPRDILVWLGPAIGADAFEVGAEVRGHFVAEHPDAEGAFRPNASGRYWADLTALARQRLARLGVTAVYGGGYCTFSDPARFFSYRRDGVTGRMASLIWLDANHPVTGEAGHV